MKNQDSSICFASSSTGHLPHERDVLPPPPNEERSIRRAGQREGRPGQEGARRIDLGWTEPLPPLGFRSRGGLPPARHSTAARSARAIAPLPRFAGPPLFRARG